MIEIESEILKQAGLPSLPPYQPKAAPTDDRFHLLFARTATLAHGQSLNNPLLSEIAPEQVLWIHPDRATAAGYRRRRYRRGQRRRQLRRQDQGESDTLDPSRGGVHAARLRRYGAARHTRPGRGVADQRLQPGKLYDFDPAGGGCAMTETIVRVRPAVAGGGNQ